MATGPTSGGRLELDLSGKPLYQLKLKYFSKSLGFRSRRIKQCGGTHDNCVRVARVSRVRSAAGQDSSRFRETIEEVNLKKPRI